MTKGREPCRKSLNPAKVVEIHPARLTATNGREAVVKLSPPSERRPATSRDGIAQREEHGNFSTTTTRGEHGNTSIARSIARMPT